MVTKSLSFTLALLGILLLTTPVAAHTNDATAPTCAVDRHEHDLTNLALATEEASEAEEAPFIFGLLKQAVGKMVVTFTPRLAGWVWDRISYTARKLTNAPSAPVTQHVLKQWYEGNGCRGFFRGSCPQCYAVAKDVTSGTSLDRMLECHQATRRN